MSAEPTNPDERPADAASGYDQTEAFHRVTDVLKCKWTLAIVNAMGNDAARPSELQRTLPGLSAKVLTDRLKKLESFGLPAFYISDCKCLYFSHLSDFLMTSRSKL